MAHQTVVVNFWIIGVDLQYQLSDPLRKTRTGCSNVAADYCTLIGARCVWAGGRDGQRIIGTDLSDAWVGALDILTGQVQPAGGVRIDGGAVVPQGTPSLSAAPATLELPLCLQTHAAAVSLGCTLVQVHCEIQEILINTQQVCYE